MSRKWETTFQRAVKDTRKLRESFKSLLTVEAPGGIMGGIIGAFIGYWNTPVNSTKFWEFALPTIGGIVGVALGCLSVYGLMFFFYWLRAPYRQRDEARVQIADLIKGRGMPKIICSKPYEGIASAQDPVLEIYIKDIHVASVSFRNESPDVSALNTWAQVTYRDTARVDELQEDILSIFPMWENEGVVGSGLSDTGDARVVELEPNGIWRTIVLAIKYPFDEVCYAYNHESYRYNDLRNPSYKLKGKKFEIEVVLNGKGIEGENFFFELTNLGKREGLVLKRKL